MPVTQTMFAKNTVSMSDLRRNPAQVFELANQSPVTILTHNKPATYLISATTYEEMLEQIEDAELTKIVKARARGKTVQVKIEDL